MEKTLALVVKYGGGQAFFTDGSGSGSPRAQDAALHAKNGMGLVATDDEARPPNLCDPPCLPVCACLSVPLCSNSHICRDTQRFTFYIIVYFIF